MSDRTAVVVGVGPPRGLGAAIARRFAGEGFRVAVMGRSAEKLEATAADLRGSGGRANFGGFASAKAALRALAQSAAREFGPQGIHVAQVIVDGAIDGDRINTFLPGLKASRGADGLLDPDAIAETFWQLYRQPRSAWTHEIDVRPWSETW